MNRSNYILVLGAALFFSQCKEDGEQKGYAPVDGNLLYTNEQLPVNEFMEWVADEQHDLAKTKALNDINYKLCYMPKQTLAYLELKDEAYTENQFIEACEHYSAMTYFNLRLELTEGSGELLKHNLSSAEQYNGRVNYMAFEMQKDIYLVQGRDTLHPGLYHFERIYEVGPYATIMLAFDDKKFNKLQDFTIVYDDKLFQKGYIKYNYKSNQLIDLPNISGV